MALAGVPARYNKVIVVIRQYGPTFDTTHRGIQCDCGVPISDFSQKSRKLMEKVPVFI
jgi:hypothetical protein